MAPAAPVPAYATFASDGDCYLYDSHTNGIVQIDSDVRQILPDFFKTDRDALESLHSDLSPEAVENAAGFLRTAIDISGMLQPPAPISFARFPSRTKYRQMLKNTVTELVVSVTDNCNLSCTYCPLNRSRLRSASWQPKKLAWDVARKSIDYFLALTSAQLLVILTFYGGEPLLEWPLVRRCMDYVRAAYPGRNIRFRLATNGTLLTGEILEFLVREEVTLKVSLDGPEPLHDANRLLRDGRGSFQKIAGILEGVRLHYSEYYRNHVVCSAAFSRRNDVLDVFRFFSENFLDHLKVLISYVSEAMDPVSEEQLRQHERNIDRLISQYLGSFENGAPFRYDLFWSLLRGVLALARKRVVGLPPRTTWPNAACIPATHRLFVSPGGKFFACEKFSDESLALGDCDAGIEYVRAQSIFHSYASLCRERCQGCWAYRLCSQCYLGMELSRSEQKSRCERERERTIKGLERLVRIWKNEPVSSYSHPGSLHYQLNGGGNG